MTTIPDAKYIILLCITFALAGCVSSRPTESEYPGYRAADEATGHTTDADSHQVVVSDPVASERSAPSLTLEDLFLSPTFTPRSFVQGRWADEGPVLTFINRGNDGGTDLVSLDLTGGRAEVVIDGGTLTNPDTGEMFEIEGYTMAPGDSVVLLFTDSERLWRTNTLGYYYYYRRATGELSAVGDREEGRQLFAKLAPDATKIGFVRDRDMFLLDLSTSREILVTSSGEEGGIINGTYDWVYEEEFRQRDGWRWSPSGEQVAYVQLDETRTPEFVMTDVREIYPAVTRFKYPKAGDPNSEIRIGVYDLR